MRTYTISADETDRAYYARRAAEQRALAERARHPEAAAAHQQLANLLAAAMFSERPVLRLFTAEVAR